MPAPMFPDLTQGGEVDLDQHRHNHQPNKSRDRKVDFRDLGGGDDVEYSREEVPECNSNNNTKSNPNREVAFESGHG